MTIRIGIVGAGPFGLAVFERIIAAIKREAFNQPVHIQIFDPASPGQGVFRHDTPAWLLLNTPCGDVNLYGEDFLHGRNDTARRSLHAWLQANDVVTAGASVSPGDFVPRAWAGAYLSSVYEDLLLRARQIANVELLPEAVIQLLENNDEVTVTTTSGTRRQFDFAFITVGHGVFSASAQPAKDERLSGEQALRCPEALSKKKVLVLGMGLVATDVVTALTQGLGGQFECQPDGTMTYVASGREATILQASRTGMPFYCRPTVSPGILHAYKPLFLTKERIGALQEAGPLDAINDVASLLYLEMRLAYVLQTAAILGETVQLPADVTEAELRMLEGRYGACDPSELLGIGEIRARNAPLAQHVLCRMLEADLQDGTRSSSPRKAALEVVRTVREALRYGLDFGAATTASRNIFRQTVESSLYRAAVGPPAIRLQEALSLVRANVLAHPFAAAPSVSRDLANGKWIANSTSLAEPFRDEVDVVVDCFLESTTPAEREDDLLGALVRSGQALRSPVYEHAIVLTKSFNPQRPDGSVSKRTFVLGRASDGSRSFNLYIPSSGSRLRAFLDIESCVQTVSALSKLADELCL